MRSLTAFFLIVSIALIFPIYASRAVPIIIAAILIADSEGCDINVVWGCDNPTGGGGEGGDGGSSQVPAPSDLSAAQSDYCIAGEPQPTLSWTYNPGSGGQSAYEIDISHDGTVDTIFHSTGKVLSSSQSYVVPGNTLEYNATYHWRLRVWDSNDVSSGFATSQFTTPAHQGPGVNFTWFPEKPVRGATILFADTSTLYGGSSASSYQWTFSPNVIPLEPPTTNASEKVKFTTLAPKSNIVKLAVTDSDNLTCSTSKDVTLTGSVFDVKEIK